MTRIPGWLGCVYHRHFLCATADASCQPGRRVEAGAYSGAVGTFVSHPPEPLLPAAAHVYQATAEVGSMGVTKLLLRKIYLERNLT